MHNTAEQYVQAVSMALHIEPCILKKGAVSINKSIDEKHFEEFIYSASIAIPHLTNVINYAFESLNKNYDGYSKTYQHLYSIVEDNERLLSSTRFWGSVELIVPFVFHRITTGKSFSGFSEFLYYFKASNVWKLDMTRMLHWKNSKYSYKKLYATKGGLGGADIFRHYQKLSEYGRTNNADIITTWCEQILNDLPIAQTFYEVIKEEDFHLIIEDIIPRTWNLFIRRFSDYKVGQLADYLVIALIEYFLNHLRRK